VQCWYFESSQRVASKFGQLFLTTFSIEVGGILGRWQKAGKMLDNAVKEVVK
jgi:hypothetical protein